MKIRTADSAVFVSRTEPRVPKVGVTKVRVDELHAFEIGAGKPCAASVCVAQIAADDRDTREISPRK